MDDFFNLLNVWFDARWLHFANAYALFCRMYKILGVAQYCDDRDSQRVQKAHQVGKAPGVLARAVRDNSELAIASVDLGDQQ